MKNITPPEYVARILRRLTENGHAAFLVGGCVRDAIMGRPVHDWDIATSAKPTDISRLFETTVLTGERFGTVTVLTGGDTVEVTTFRSDGEYRDGRRPESVEFVANLEEDLSRRDFTMNAIAVSGKPGFVDPHGGVEDIKNRVIRCVGDPCTRFSEDALRMFRAFRFSAELGFAIEPATMRAIGENAGMSKLISAERVCVELEKTLMSQRPEIAGEMIKAGLLDRYLAASGNNPDDSDSLDNPDDPDNSDSLDWIASLPNEKALRWCAFCAALLDSGLLTSATEFLHEMRLDRKTARACALALAVPELPGDRIGVKQLLAKHGEDAVRCAAAVSQARKASKAREASQASKASQASEASQASKTNEASKARSRPQPSCPPAHLALVDEIIASGECYSLGKLAITGSDLIALGHPPGHEIGEMLDMLLGHVINCPEDNSREALLKLLRSPKKETGAKPR